MNARTPPPGEDRRGSASKVRRRVPAAGSRADQVRASIAKETRQQRRANPLKRQLEHAVGRIRLGGDSPRIDIGLDPPPAGRRRERVAITDERERFGRVGLGLRVPPAVDAPSRGADSPADQGFRRIVGQPDGDVDAAPGEVERLVR